jgi:hypothetical protein
VAESHWTLKKDKAVKIPNGVSFKMITKLYNELVDTLQPQGRNGDHITAELYDRS